MTHIVTLVQVELRASELAMSSSEIGGNTLVVNLSLATLNLGWIGNIKVIGDATILFSQIVVAVKEGLHLIAVANVATKRGSNWKFLSA